MSNTENHEELKAVILKLLKTIEELKTCISPVIKGQDYAQRALKSHEEALKELMQSILVVGRKQETMQKDLADIRDYVFDQKFFQEVETRIGRLENVFLSRIVKKVKSESKLSKSEFEEFRTLVEKGSDPSSWIVLGLAYDNEKLLKESLESYEKAIKIDNRNIHALCLKGGVLQRMGKHDEALKVFEEVWERSKCPLVLRNQAYSMAVLRRNEEALKFIDKAIQSEEQDARSWALKAHILRNMDRKLEALGCLEKALELDPNLVVALEGKGIVLLDLGSSYHKEALASFEKAIELDPKSSELWHNKGEALFALGKTEEAIMCYDKAIQLNPKNSCAYCGRGRLRGSSGDHLGAIKDFVKALEIGLPSYCGEFHGFRAMSLESLEKYDEALESVLKGLSIEPKSVFLLTTKASVLVKLKRNDDAKEAIEAAIQASPTDEGDLNTIAYTLYELGEPSRALDFANKAVEKNPENAAFLDTLACILSKLGKNEESLRLFETAIKIRKNDADITWSELADLYQRMGRNEDEKVIREKYIKK